MSKLQLRTSQVRLGMERLEDRATPALLASGGYEEGRVLVTLADSWRAAEDMRALLRNPLAAEAERIGGGIYQVNLRPGVDVGTAVTVFATAPGVRTVEPDYILSVAVTPNDPHFGSLWGLHNSGQGGAADADIDAPEAWDVARGTGQTVVAVIDTGVDYAHPDLAGNMWRNPGEVAGNGVDDDGNGIVDDIYGADFANNDGNPMDDHGHGTHVAGTVGAVGNNGVGVTGVAWTTRVMAVKFLGSDGSGTTSNAVRAIDYAVAKGAKVLNNSWGGAGHTSTLQAAVERAGTAGAVFVVAAGNSGANNDVTANYPTNYSLTYPHVIAVAATDGADNRASFSNYGAQSVTLGAPGVNILSTVPGGGYGWMSGTSMAAPQVSGALAVLWDQNPGWSAQQVIDRMKQSVDPLSSLSGITTTGGRLNLAKMVGAGQSSTPGGSAAYIGSDAATQGSWQAKYGADGYTLAQGPAAVPSYAQVTPAGHQGWTWAASTADPRALQKPGATDRLAATWYSGTAFTVDLAVTGGPRRVSAYFVDWDTWGGGRSQRVEVLDAATGAVLDSREVSGFQAGRYLTWDVAGHVRIRVTNLNPAANAVLSGLFFD